MEITFPEQKRCSGVKTEEEKMFSDKYLQEEMEKALKTTKLQEGKVFYVPRRDENIYPRPIWAMDESYASILIEIKTHPSAHSR